MPSKNIKRYSYLIAILIPTFIVNPVIAGDPGTTGFNFLKIPVGARGVAMGESNVAVSEGADSIYWNPAGLAHQKNVEFYFSHNKWFEEIDHQYLSCVAPTVNVGSFGAYIYRLGMDEFQGYDANGVPNKEVDAGDWMGGVSWAKEVKSWQDSRSLSFGMTTKYIVEKLDDQSASAFAGDFGFLFKNSDRGFKGDWWDKDISLGLFAGNLGTDAEFDSDAYSLPKVYKLGLGYKRILEGQPFCSSLDFITPLDNDTYYSAGLEYYILGTIALRTGYRSECDEGSGFMAGIGVKTGICDLDYAFADYGIFGGTHRIGVSFSFAGRKAKTKPYEPVMSRKELSLLQTPDEIFKHAETLYQQGRYYEAIKEFNRVLEKEPSRWDALEMMRKANNRLQRLE